MRGVRMNVHGAGAQRSDPKSGDPGAWKNGNGPQGDEVRIRNYVRCVRGGQVIVETRGPAIAGGFTASRRGTGAGGTADRSSRWFVARLDRDGDGRVSRAEFDGPPGQFDVLDRNRDGYLSGDEAPSGPPGRRLPPPP